MRFGDLLAPWLPFSCCCNLRLSMCELSRFTLVKLNASIATASLYLGLNYSRTFLQDPPSHGCPSQSLCVPLLGSGCVVTFCCCCCCLFWLFGSVCHFFFVLVGGGPTITIPVLYCGRLGFKKVSYALRYLKPARAICKGARTLRELPTSAWAADAHKLGFSCVVSGT